MAGPYILPTHDTFVQWASDVKAGGGVVTAFPRGAEAGAYAARFPAEGGLPPSRYTYVLAPLAVLAWQFGQITEGQYTQALADFQDFIRSIGSNVAENIGDVVGDIGSGLGEGLVSAISGWWWLLAAVGVGAYIFRDELHGVARRHLSRL